MDEEQNRSASMEKIESSLEEIKKSLAHIVALLKYMPEIQAGIFFQMQDEYNEGRWRNRRAADLWDVIPPNRR